MGEQVPGEYVAKKMCLEVIIFGRAEIVVEGLAHKTGLHLGSLLKGVIAGRKRRGLRALVRNAAFLHDFLQSSQCIQRAREPCVGI